MKVPSSQESYPNTRSMMSIKMMINVSWSQDQRIIEFRYSSWRLTRRRRRWYMRGSMQSKPRTLERLVQPFLGRRRRDREWWSPQRSFWIKIKRQFVPQSLIIIIIIIKVEFLTLPSWKLLTLPSVFHELPMGRSHCENEGKRQERGCGFSY